MTSLLQEAFQRASALPDEMQELLAEELLSRIDRKPDRGSVIVPIQSLAPLPFEVVRPILAVVQEEEGAFVASFFDANINASGESQLEAVEMLKHMIASSFQLFSGNESVLGETPRGQLAVLGKFIRAR